MTKNEKLSIFMSGVAILISIAAMVVGTWQFNQSHSSQITIAGGVLPFEDNDSLQFKDYPTSYRTSIKLRLTNIGNVRTSIIGIEIDMMLPSEDNRKTPYHQPLYCYGVQKGRVQHEFLNEDGTPVKFPLVIESKSAVYLKVMFEPIIPSEIWNIVKSQIPINQRILNGKTKSIWNDAGFVFPEQTRIKEKPRSSKHWRYYWLKVVKEDGLFVDGQFDIGGTVYLETSS